MVPPDNDMITHIKIFVNRSRLVIDSGKKKEEKFYLLSFFKKL